MTPRIGLTGGIASGKTLVAAMFEICGAAVAFADDMARGLMETPGTVKNQLIDLLGEDAYLENGVLDREGLGARLFTNPTLLDQVNAIVHPAVRRSAETWHERMATKVPYTVYESALIFEANLKDDFDIVVHVYAPERERLRRAMLRDGAEEKAIRAKMDSQWSDTQRLAQNAYVIINDGSQLLTKQVWELHQELVKRTGWKS